MSRDDGDYTCGHHNADELFPGRVRPAALIPLADNCAKNHPELDLLM
jgi:hypothetical protein